MCTQLLSLDLSDDCGGWHGGEMFFWRLQVVEKETGLATCVIYGALPPEMRRLQARLFNERDNEFTVLVASDAVGMGLNLNIRRIIFHTLLKYDGAPPDALRRHLQGSPSTGPAMPAEKCGFSRCLPEPLRRRRRCVASQARRTRGGRCQCP